MEQKEFDSFAKSYRDIHTENVQAASGKDSDYFSEYKIKNLFEYKAVRPDASWLDLGCGDGNTYKYIKKYFSDCTYKGIDVSQESIREARQSVFLATGQDGIFSSYDGSHIPFEDNSFDVIFVSCVLHHVLPENRPALIRECSRVLKEDGQLIIFEHNPLNPVTMKLVNTCPFDENAVLLTYGTAKKLLNGNGFKINKHRYTLFVPRKGFLEKLTGIEKALTWLPAGGQYYVIAGKK